MTTRDAGVAWRETADMRDDEPSYLALHASGELEDRSRRALSLFADTRCRVCPRLCKVDRLSDQAGLCRVSG